MPALEFAKQPLRDISKREVRPNGNTEPAIATAEPDPCIGAVWIAPEPGGNNRPAQENTAPSRLRRTFAAASRAFRNAASAGLGVIVSAAAQTATTAATAAAAVAAPADPAQAPAAVAAPANPVLAPAHCQVADGERVLSESEIQQGLADGVAAMRARRANLEGALARPGALQQRQIAAPQFVACALAVQMTDVVFQTNQEVQASTQAADITVCR